jgi:hypothetical protein
LTALRVIPKIEFPYHEHAMGLTTPFSGFNLLDADQIEAMREAFRRVCDILQLQCGREDQLTEVVGLKIVELARAGERDPETLCMDVLAALGMSSNDVTPTPSARNWDIGRDGDKS